jgi:hypothetical protein
MQDHCFGSSSEGRNQGLDLLAGWTDRAGSKVAIAFDYHRPQAQSPMIPGRLPELQLVDWHNLLAIQPLTDPNKTDDPHPDVK